MSSNWHCRMDWRLCKFEFALNKRACFVHFSSIKKITIRITYFLVSCFIKIPTPIWTIHIPIAVRTLYFSWILITCRAKEELIHPSLLLSLRVMIGSIIRILSLVFLGCDKTKASTQLLAEYLFDMYYGCFGSTKRFVLSPVQILTSFRTIINIFTSWQVRVVILFLQWAHIGSNSIVPLPLLSTLFSSDEQHSLCFFQSAFWHSTEQYFIFLHLWHSFNFPVYPQTGQNFRSFETAVASTLLIIVSRFTPGKDCLSSFRIFLQSFLCLWLQACVWHSLEQ